MRVNKALMVNLEGYYGFKGAKKKVSRKINQNRLLKNIGGKYGNEPLRNVYTRLFNTL